MSGTRAIVDTNLVLYVLQGDRSAADLLADRDIILSYITCMELLAEPALPASELAARKAFIESWPMIDMHPAIMETGIRFRRDFKLKLPDAIIAATAHFLDVPLFTADKGFESVRKEIKVILYER